MSLEHLYLAPGEGETSSLRATEVIFKASGERPASGPTVTEFITAPGFNTGDHVHSRIEELFYVVDGEIDIRAGQWSGRVGPGGFVRVPPGTPHGFGNSTSVPATVLLIISPGGVHDEYFRELASILAEPGPPDTEAVGELRNRYDTLQVSPLTAR
jgi:mannose-6-phosphate isomerase-like protein (cupin superfamily)